ncbi:hypothetical protein ACFC0X_24065 [Paenibacillus chitinolyticus]|uniref:hypothetical protein n=1 Tax=Paenibacillus chitinolyticus TaxID=79263 RepID=UPI0035DD9EA9
MDHTQQQRLLDFLKQEFSPDDTIHLLAISAVEQLHEEYSLVTTAPPCLYADSRLEEQLNTYST